MKAFPRRPVIPHLPRLATMAAILTVGMAAELPLVSFRAVYFDPRETVTPQLFVAHGKARRPLELDKSRLSDRQQASVRNGGLVDFFNAGEPQKDEVPAATLTLPGGALENLLLVLVPAAKGYRAWAIPLPPAEFQPGSTLLINVAPVLVTVKQGAAVALAVKPGSARVLALAANFKESMLPIQIFVKRDDAAAWKIAQSTRWAVDRRFRSYVFFYQTPKSEQLMLHGITERMDHLSESEAPAGTPAQRP